MDTSGKLKLQEVFLSVFLCFTPICIFLYIYIYWLTYVWVVESGCPKDLDCHVM